MKINLQDPTPLTSAEALIMVLDAREYVDGDLRLPIHVAGYASIELRSAEYRIRHEVIAEKIGRIP
jgi:hypothetical protein